MGKAIEQAAMYVVQQLRPPRIRFLSKLVLRKILKLILYLFIQCEF